jgi:hypothetical protein
MSEKYDPRGVYGLGVIEMIRQAQAELDRAIEENPELVRQVLLELFEERHI